MGDKQIKNCIICMYCCIFISCPFNRNYSLERMFTNQLLESAKEELSFRTVVRDLKSKSLLVQLILLNPNSWSCTGYCLDSDCSVGSMSKIDFHPIIKVLFADYRNYSESELRFVFPDLMPYTSY